MSNQYRRNKRLSFEPLESRHLLSATGMASPQLVVMNPATVNNSAVVGYTPTQIRAAYGFDQVSFTNSRGASLAATGVGQTIAIVDAYNDPNIVADAATFSRKFGLPLFNQPGGPTLTVESQTGSTTALPVTDAGWATEIALDVEWTHAIAPGANIVLVEANTDNFPDLLLAVNHAKMIPAVSVVAMSWGGSEFTGETTWDSAFLARGPHIGETFVAASGDDGSPPEWPGVSPWVLSVGGTSLNLTPSNTYGSETGWSSSSGGIADDEAEPAFQAGVQSTGRRANPDVAYVGDPDTGVAVYDSVPSDGQTGWCEIGGTSAGTPQWAALIAIANQGRALMGLGTLSNAQATLYRLPATDFHDITAGNNGGFSAGPGYDGVTGLGSPLANLVIQHLVNGVPARSAAPVSSNTGIGSSSPNVLHGGRFVPAVAGRGVIDANSAILIPDGITDVRPASVAGPVDSRDPATIAETVSEPPGTSFAAAYVSADAQSSEDRLNPARIDRSAVKAEHEIGWDRDFENLDMPFKKFAAMASPFISLDM